jgi:hypothetical protein
MAMKTVQQQSLISRINDVLATRITMLVGTIWAFYAFVIFGLTSILWPGYEEQILYWSNFLQLVFLPIITVGTTILSRDSEARAIEDHKKISKEFDMLRNHDKRVAHLLQEMSAGISQLHLLVAQSGPPVSSRPAPGTPSPRTGAAKSGR